nr:cysteine-rich venom protein TEL1-like [Pogona vitticeps]XP_020646275.1 cysteine-rich venom protein TEL1-like [Pogona vitticeps]
MSLLLALLATIAGLHQCAGNEDHDKAFAALSTDLLTVQDEIIDKHNDLRRQVEPRASDMLKMEWNGTAASTAKSWADGCVYKHSHESQRIIEGGMSCGENLFYSSVPKSWSDAIQAWFNEFEYFIFGVGPSHTGEQVGHYTQVVWYSSFLLGCAVAECSHDIYNYFYVCHYCPAGNVMGRRFRPYTIGTTCGNCTDYCDDGLCTNPCPGEDKISNCLSLKKKHPCTNPLLQEMCPASCHCENKIY